MATLMDTVQWPAHEYLSIAGPPVTILMSNDQRNAHINMSKNEPHVPVLDKISTQLMK